MPGALECPPSGERRGRGNEGVREGVSAIPKKVFVGNLSYDVTREELLEAFGAAGKVVDAKVPTDRETGRPRGFAFVEFETDEGVERAVALLNGQPLRGRPLRVNEAEDRPPGERGPRPGGGGFAPRPGGGAGGFTPRPGGPGPRPGGFGPRPGGFSPRPGGFGMAPPPMGEEATTGERRRRPMTTTDRDRNKNFKAKEPRRVEKRRRNNTDDDFDI